MSPVIWCAEAAKLLCVSRGTLCAWVSTNRVAVSDVRLAPRTVWFYVPDLLMCLDQHRSLEPFNDGVEHGPMGQSE